MKSKLISPSEIIEQLHHILNAAAVTAELSTSVINSFSQDKISAFRVNTLKTSVVELTEQLAASGIQFSPVAASEFSFTVNDKSQLTRHSLANQGYYYIQNLSSQLTVAAMQPHADHFILDLAAAPGGKTSLIAQYMNNQGRISAVELVKDRYYRLIANLRNLGVTIARCYNKDGRVVGKLCPQWFDQVLLDAPCSSMAQIDLRVPDSYAHWNLKKVKECARKQKQLICSAFASLKPGGELTYSTCSWMVEENEAVVDHLLQTYPQEASVIDCPLVFGNSLNGLTSYQGQAFNPQLALSRRIIPDQLFEAFYIAKIKKAN